MAVRGVSRCRFTLGGAILLVAIGGCQSQDEEPASNLKVSVRFDANIESLIRVAWEQPSHAMARVEYRFDDEPWQSTPEREIDSGPAEMLVLGVPFDTEVVLRVVPDGRRLNAVSREIVARTGALPELLPVPALKISDPDRYETTGRYFLGSIKETSGEWHDGPFWTFIVDRKGRLVWARRGEDRYYSVYVQLSRDHDILQDANSYWSKDAYGDGSDGHIERLRLDGEIRATYATPGLFHPFLELPDRSLVWADGRDQTVHLRRQDMAGHVEHLWSCEGFEARAGQKGRCALNAIFYREASDTLLVCLPLDAPFVVELDRATGEPLRWFGDVPGGWGFDPPSGAFVLPHGATWTDAGTLLVSSQASLDDKDGVVREYELDPKSETLEQIWTHGKEQGIKARFGGAAIRLPSRNTLHTFGTTPRIQEISRDGDVVWDLGWPGDRRLGRVTPIDDLYPLAP